MTIYRIKSMKYRDYFIEGPNDTNLEELEEEFFALNQGTIPEFVLWLLDHKGFQPLKATDYSCNRG